MPPRGECVPLELVGTESPLPFSSDSKLPSLIFADASSCPTQKSHATHPIIVTPLPHPTTVMGETRSWKMPVKQHTKIATLQTCCTMTVESATSRQNS